MSRVHTHFWIDAICINQYDLEEKAAQVNLMGETYRQAECCVVSLGRHTKDSTFIYRHIIEDHFSAGHCNGDTLEAQVRRWSSKADAKAVQRLSSALVAFGNHSYWRRLWIVQEFSLPRKVFMLCGSQCLPLEDIASVYKGYNFLKYLDHVPTLSITKTLAIRTQIQDSRYGGANLPQILRSLGERECFDPRDKVFGLLSLVDWNLTSSPTPLDADYTLSPCQLAIKVIKHCRVDDTVRSYHSRTKIARQLLDMFKIDPHMAAEAQSRAIDNQSHSTDGAAVKTVLVQHIVLNRYKIQDPFLTRLNSAELGNAGSSTQITLTVSSLVELDTSMIFVDIGALLENLDSVGPWASSVSGDYRNVVVLKPVDQSSPRYQVVCHGFMEFSVSNHAYDHTYGWLTGTSFYLDDEDLFFWVWKLYHLPVDQRRVGMLNFRFCRDHSTSYARLR